MSAMRNQRRVAIALGAIALTLISILVPTSAPAISFKSAPANTWGEIRAGNESSNLITQPKRGLLEGEQKSKWQVNFEDFPEETKAAVNYAVDIWSRNFASDVEINVDAVWETNSNGSVLGSARPGFYFSAFPGAPDPTIWYPSALANSLAKRDLNPKQAEIFLSINSNQLWYIETDGKPAPGSYDLVSVVLHELAHGLGFLSNAEYDRFFGTGYIFQATAFDAYTELPDGRTFADFCSRSIELGKAMVNPLLWSGPKASAANGGVKPKLYTPPQFEEGSSVTHLDEQTFGKSSTDSMMTPVLNPGEVFTSPGPIALAMIEDMLTKPTVGAATGVPTKPVNVKALVGDKYALLTFDTPNCSRADRVTSYEVKISPTGEVRKFKSAPIKITGLKNGKRYSFTLSAENSKGSSEAVESNSIKPEPSEKSRILDGKSQVGNLTTIDFQNRPTIFYSDTKNRSLKSLSYTNGKWRPQVIRKGIDVGRISVCTTGSGSSAELHLFYADIKKQDIIYSNLKSGKWVHGTLDGDGDDVQDYRELNRRKTAADVSVSNACAVTKSGLQVFYRDETQGILLGAVKTKAGWVYEVVDGDRRTDDRTTGDVAFQLSAISDGQLVYLLYDSILTLNSNKDATEGEVRLAVRKSVFPEDWRYTTLDGPEQGNAVAGYATALHTSKGRVKASWLSARGDSLPNPSQINFVRITDSDFSEKITTSTFGAPGRPLSIDGTEVVFGCAGRICRAGLDSGETRLVNGAQQITNSAQLITIGKARYLVAGVKGKLSLIRL